VRGVFDGSSASKEPALRECTEECGDPDTRSHHLSWETASGIDVQVAVPVPNVFSEGSSTWNTIGSSASAIPSWNDTLPEPMATCGMPPWKSRSAKAGRRSRASRTRRSSRVEGGLTDLGPSHDRQSTTLRQAQGERSFKDVLTLELSKHFLRYSTI